MSNSIPFEWINKYVNSLLDAAKKFGLDSQMGQACMNRADVIMDMVQAYKEKKE